MPVWGGWKVGLAGRCTVTVPPIGVGAGNIPLFGNLAGIRFGLVEIPDEAGILCPKDTEVTGDIQVFCVGVGRDDFNGKAQGDIAGWQIGRG